MFFILFFTLIAILSYYLTFHLLDFFYDFFSSKIDNISDNFGEIPKKEVYTFLIICLTFLILIHFEKKNPTPVNYDTSDEFRRKKYFKKAADFCRLEKPKRDKYIEDYKELSLKHNTIHLMEENFIFFDQNKYPLFYNDLMKLNKKYNLPMKFILTNEFIKTWCNGLLKNVK